MAHPELRDGQLEMILQCLGTIEDSKVHLASAPTGVGKTAAALAAALEHAQSSKKKKTILFLTPRQSQHKIVVDTVRKINDQLDPEKNPVKLVDIIGRDSMCEVIDIQTGRCFCEKKVGEDTSANRRDDMKRYILESPRHVGETLEKCKTWGICAWNACRLAAKECDILVCDYNHVFMEEVRKASLNSMDLVLDNLILIVDEAHNLPDRIRMGMQRRLTPTIVRNAILEIEENLERLQNTTTTNEYIEINITLKEWSLKVCKEFRRILSREFKSLIDKIGDQNEIRIEAKIVIDWLNESFDAVAAVANQETLTGELATITTPKRAVRLDKFKQLLLDNEVEIDEEGDNEQSAHLLAKLIDVLVRFGGGTALCLVFDGEGKDGRVISHLLDAGLVAEEIFAKTAGSILMSGTLDPPHMFADLLGIKKNNRGESIHPSPFAKERRPIVVATDVTTLWKERGVENNRKIRQHIFKLAKVTPGNIAAFVPSYKILNELFEDMYIPGVKLRVEERKWTKQDIGSLLVELEDSKKLGNKILLAGVFNGKLSEGVDYKGGMLDSVICIGIPNAPPSVYHNALGDYISQKFGPEKKWRYTTLQPSVNSILQAMGRPIRAIGDRALILLLDRRNSERTYQVCYPPDTIMNHVSNSDGTEIFARRFFSKVKWEGS